MLNLLGATDGVWDWRVGTEEIRFAPGFRKLLGFTADDLQSKNHFMQFDGNEFIYSSVRDITEDKRRLRAQERA